MSSRGSASCSIITSAPTARPSRVDAIGAARTLLRDAIARRIFPAAAVHVGTSRGVLWQEPFGTLSFDSRATPTELSTPFDLASLAKPIAATSLVLQLIDRGRIALDDMVSESFPEWRGSDRAAATVRDLLEHAAGLSARLIDAPPSSRTEFVHDICAMPLEYPVRTRSIYSDLGFILLGFLVEDRGGDSLAAQFTALFDRVADEATPDDTTTHLLTYDLPPALRATAAPTRPLDDDVRRGRWLTGEVHDNYAAALRGSAGHAGLFGTAPAVGLFARTVLRAARGDISTPAPLSPTLIALATTKSRVPGSSRALGWDTMLPTSSCGTRMSPSAFGHVGFTGTSLWIDPERDRYVVLLTNRAADGGSSEEMQTVRRAFHDALGDL